ncbi:MAG TPA: carboxypeptidase-like regulatory domain-containing protein [Edaphobacter sp.]|nr:carboxypeptidase-like regulatory domain-containing protein [Edaphobacter sp.]
MNAKTCGLAASLLAGILWTSSPCAASSSLKLSGELAGFVKDPAGIPQMGASIQLFNRYDRLIQKTLSSATGQFSFASLAPDLYSIHITLASFVPAVKRNISIQPGMKSVLAINLATVLSSIELISTGPSSRALMSDDWIWVLRSTMSSRPVLRILPEIDISDPEDRNRNRTGSSAAAGMFSDTRGVVKLSSGESNPFSSAGNQPDLGTTFALATSLYGRNNLQFSGNIGYAANSAMPATGFRTSFSRGDVGGPEVKLTVQQFYLPAHGLSPMIGGQGQDNVPALRSMSLTMLDRLDIAENILLEYGASLDSVSFMDRLNYLSPFARLSFDLESKGTFAIAYSSGMPPVELLGSPKGSPKEEDSSLQQDISALTMFPRVSVRNGTPYVQRTQTMELGYKVTEGSRTYSVGVYREMVGNGALTMNAPSDFYSQADLIPELSSPSSVFNIGKYTRTGMMASVTQAVNENLSVTLAYGDGGTLRTEGRKLMTNDPDELRSMIHSAQHQWVMGRVAGTVPVTGTRFVSSYEWTDYRSLTPGHVYLVQKFYPEAGLNVRIKQPIPQFGGFRGRLEATAEFRNMLAQGYLPISTADNRTLILTNSPRAVRGGVSFIF